MEKRNNRSVALSSVILTSSIPDITRDQGLVFTVQQGGGINPNRASFGGGQSGGVRSGYSCNAILFSFLTFYFASERRETHNADTKIKEFLV